MKCKVSIVIPQYLRSNYLVLTINSILNQTFQDFEIIIIDDCSPDNTQEVIKRFSDQRIRYHRFNKNKGYLHAINYGIKLSLGEYILRIDNDDELLNNHIETAINIMDSNSKIGVFCCDAFIINSNGEKVSEKTYLNQNLETSKVESGIKTLGDVFLDGCVHFPGSVIRRDVFERVGFFKPDILSGDTEFWLRVAAHSYFIYLDKTPLIKYRVHEGSLQSNKIQIAEETLAIHKNFYHKYPSIRELNWRAKRRIAMKEAYLSILHFKNGTYKKSIKYAVESFKNYPFILFRYLMGLRNYITCK